jgi:hypothetical protein
MTDKEAMKLALDALELSKISVDNFRVQKVTQEAIAALKERLLADPMREVQRLGQEIEPKIGCVNHDCDQCKAQPEQEPVPTLEDLEQEIYQNTRNFISRDVMEWMLRRYYTHLPQPEQELEAAPVAKNEGGKITWMIDDWPQNCFLYTHPPKSFSYEQVKAHIRAASMSANDIVVGSDVTNDGVSIVIRRRDEILYAEFFAHPPQRTEPVIDKSAAIRIATVLGWTPPRTWVGLTDEEVKHEWTVWRASLPRYIGFAFGIEAKLKEKNT